MDKGAGRSHPTWGGGGRVRILSLGMFCSKRGTEENGDGRRTTRTTQTLEQMHSSVFST